MLRFATLTYTLIPSNMEIFYTHELLEQSKLKQCLLGFDDNKVFKVQLDMLIFVQVCRIID